MSPSWGEETRGGTVLSSGAGGRWGEFILEKFEVQLTRLSQDNNAQGEGAQGKV